MYDNNNIHLFTLMIDEHTIETPENNISVVRKKQNYYRMNRTTMEIIV